MQGGTSGIGVTAIQMAAAMGNRVFATAGTDEKCAACVKLGAQTAFNYKTQDFVAGVKAATGGKGVDVILDMAAGDFVPQELKAPGRRRAPGVHRLPARREDRARRERSDAQAPDDHRLDAAPAPGRVQGRDRRRACARRSGR